MKTSEKITTIQEIQLSYQVQPDVLKREAIKSSLKAHELVSTLFDPLSIGLREEFHALLLNKANKPLGFVKLSQGGIDSTVVDIRLLMATALKSAASAVILCHNHPSGSLKPSQSDIKITNKIKEAGQFLDIQLLDHLIVNPLGEYMSMADEGIL